MMQAAPIPDTLTLQVPFRVISRGGRKEMVLPAGAMEQRRTDGALIRALARAFRWKRLLDTGTCLTIAEVAEREGVAMSYVSRMVQLTLLAPDIVEAILNGGQGPEVTLGRLLQPLPFEWEAQRSLLGPQT